jgi:hypothetical protein
VLCAFARVIFFVSVHRISTDNVENTGLALRSKLRDRGAAAESSAQPAMRASFGRFQVY